MSSVDVGLDQLVLERVVAPQIGMVFLLLAPLKYFLQGTMKNLEFSGKLGPVGLD